mmetsp:Transcript_74499/g.206939  ORF Transcript_74499/g.206939 Transcript_74499/m.206939 type:complete len:290 (-) Transcript_74499:3-872(-)
MVATAASRNADAHCGSTRETCANRRSKNCFRSDSLGSPRRATYPNGASSVALSRISRCMVATMAMRLGGRASSPLTPTTSRRHCQIVKAASGASSSASTKTTTGTPVLATVMAVLQKLLREASAANKGKILAPAAAAAASVAALLPRPEGPFRRMALRSPERQKRRERTPASGKACGDNGSTTASRNSAFASSKPTMSAKAGEVRGSRGVVAADGAAPGALPLLPAPPAPTPSSAAGGALGHSPVLDGAPRTSRCTCSSVCALRSNSARSRHISAAAARRGTTPEQLAA